MELQKSLPQSSAGVMNFMTQCIKDLPIDGYNNIVYQDTLEEFMILGRFYKHFHLSEDDPNFRTKKQNSLK